MFNIKIFCLIFIFLFFSIFNQFISVKKRFSQNTYIEECPWCEINKEKNDVIFIPYKTILIKAFSPADNEFIADLLWLKTCYYFGYHFLTDKQYDYLFFLIDKITDLSESWIYPYIFGVVSLSSESDSSFEALALADKGIEKFPDSWKLFFFKGYIFWQHFNDYKNASDMFFKASQKEESPKYLLQLSAKFAKKTGDKELINKFFEVALETIKDPLQRKILTEKMKE
ncbi:MAG: hypothetical protein CSA18_03905 [Deltaproteobacteria bacterium]|nr:MAG: hypothetical protein CSB21_00465 [Deltaproteobacteria bacterium]PIE74703.1 MAG: hypothetical protein CSA18_03905 [Deltaproteobacteria bacterium]